MGLEISGGEKTLHILNVDDAILDRRDWEQPRGQGETERGIGVGFSGKVQGGNSPQPPLALPHKCYSDGQRMDVERGSQGGKSRLKSAHPALMTEHRSNVCLPPTSTKSAGGLLTGLRQWEAGQ